MNSILPQELSSKAVLIKVIIIANLIFSSYLEAQPVVYKNGDFGGISDFTTYSTEQGLALSGIASSFVDHLGNIWFGTYGGGVCRYDGKSFVTYTIKNGLSGNVVLSIYEDRMGNLWFGSNRGGLTKYDGKKFISFTTKEGLAHNTILCITEDRFGVLWFGTYGGGISKYNGKTFQTINKENGLPDNGVRSIFFDNKNNAWIGTLNSGVCKFDGKTYKTYTTKDGLPHNGIFTILQDNNENLWFGTIGGGISRFDGEKFQNFSESKTAQSNLIWCSYKDHSGNLWFGTRGGGLIRYDGKEFTKFTTYNGLNSNFIFTITQDKSGYIWLGTYGSGVVRYDGKAFVSFTTKQGLASNLIYSILQDRDGNYWLGTYSNGLNKLTVSSNLCFDEKLILHYTTANGLNNNDVKALCEDRKGNIWLGTVGGGVSRLSKKGSIKFENFTTKDGLPDDRVHSILEDSKGNIWFGTSGGLCRFDGKTFKNYSTKDGLVDRIVLCILEDKKGNLWLGTSGGVNSFDGKTFKSYTTKNGLAHNIVFSMVEDKNGFIWFGTDGGGISRFDGTKFLTYTTEDGLSNNTVGQIVQDKVGRIFFGTNLGLSVLVGWNKSKPIFENFNKQTGFPIKDIVAGCKGMIIDKTGAIWIGTGDETTALIRFDYNEIKKNYLSPKVVIRNVRIHENPIAWYDMSDTKDSVLVNQQEIITLGRKLSVTERDSIRKFYSGVKFESIKAFYPIPIGLVVPHKNNSITFGFTAIEPSKPYLVKYQYILEGYENYWSPITNRTSAVFGNITSGKYTFRLKALSANGTWSEPISYSFVVLPPWYLSFWAYLGYLTGFILFVYLSIFLNSKRLKKINLQLESVVNERTSEIAKQNEELVKQAWQIQEQALKLQEANASKDKFFRIIAHDLRGPIGSLINLTEVMSNESEGYSIEEFTQISSSINKSADNLYKLMNNLLEWAKMQQEGIKLNLADHNLFELVGQCLSGIDESAKRKKIILENQIEDNVIVYADEKMLNTILRNLISNAIKFTPHEGRVIVSANSNDKEIEILVTDTGVGISSGDLTKIFKIDEKTGRVGTDNEPSTGLGLVLCKEFIEKHNGKITVESKVGEGSIFRFTIPKKNNLL